jgi:hypothetical protein
MKHYLSLCLQGAFDLAGKEGVENFKISSYPADGTTTIAQFLDVEADSSVKGTRLMH